MNRIFFLLLTFFLTQTIELFAQDTLSKKNDWDTTRYKEITEWGKYFREEGVTGTIIIYDQQKGKYSVYNKERYRTRYLPASTFKILNSLIALETEVIKSEKEVIKWDGFDRGNAQWNQDLNLKKAYQFSAVWFYQELARRIGYERMLEWVSMSGYGNKDITGGIDDFWLRGKLRISAWEQIDFLKRLQSSSLGFKEEVMATVKEIMIEEKNSNYTLRSKTGWAIRAEKQIGWYVGWVERPRKDSKEKRTDNYYFALNIDMDETKLSARKTIVRKILLELKLI